MESEANTNICPKCQHLNPDEATTCQLCGTELKPTTLPVQDMVDAQSASQADEATAGQKPTFRGIALWVRNNPRPLIVDAEKGAILGRRVSDEHAPTLIDLTDHNAYKLGVSRRHAQLDCTGQGCLLIDLGSSNGTWVNGLRLQPYQPAVLKSGDRVYLARLEMIVGPLSEEALQRARYAPPEGEDARTKPVAPVDASPWAETSAQTTNALADKYLDQPITADVAESAAKATGQAESAPPAADSDQAAVTDAAGPDSKAAGDVGALPSPAQPPKIAAPQAAESGAEPAEDAKPAPSAEKDHSDAAETDKPAAKADDAVIALPPPVDKARLAAPGTAEPGTKPAPSAADKDTSATGETVEPAAKTDAETKPAETTDNGKPVEADTKNKAAATSDDNPAADTTADTQPSKKNGSHGENA